MPPTHYYTITRDRDGFRARFYYGGELMWWTEGYSRIEKAQNAIDSIRHNGGSAPQR
jgi:uncharacterized protein YegP (UPF0339 family)